MMEGGTEKGEVPEGILKGSDWIITVYQTIGVFYFVVNSIILGRFSAFSSMILALTFSSVATEAFYFNRIVLEELVNYPFLICGVVNIVMGIMAFIITGTTEGSTAVDWGCSTITLAYGGLNFWRALLVEDLEKIGEPHPWTFLVQGIVQIVIMIICLFLKPEDGYGCIDEVAIFITLVMAVDAILDNLTDLYLLVAKTNEDGKTYLMILVFKIIYNPLIAYLGFYLWSTAHSDWVERNGEECKKLEGLESPSDEEKNRLGYLEFEKFEQRFLFLFFILVNVFQTMTSVIKLLPQKIMVQSSLVVVLLTMIITMIMFPNIAKIFSVSFKE